MLSIYIFSNGLNLITCTYGLHVFHFYSLIRTYMMNFNFFQGFPKGSNIGEQERVSCPNAQYTKGDFMVSTCLA